MTSKSAAKLIPPNPSAVMVIRDITPNLTTLSVPFNRFGRMKIGGRGTIVKLSSGALAVFSPVALTPEVTSKLQSLGNNVKYLAALDIEHHIFLTPWSQAYPAATVIGMEGLPEKRAKDPATASVKFHHIFKRDTKLSQKIDEEFDAEFEYEYVDAHGNKELVFFHRPTRTVIEADLLFNLPATEQYSKLKGTPEGNLNAGFANKLFQNIMSGQGGAIWQKRFAWYLVAKADRRGMKESVERMDKWDFERIVPCHGDIIEGREEARGTWDKMFEWFRKMP